MAGTGMANVDSFEGLQQKIPSCRLNWRWPFQLYNVGANCLMSFLLPEQFLPPSSCFLFITDVAGASRLLKISNRCQV